MIVSKVTDMYMWYIGGDFYSGASRYPRTHLSMNLLAPPLLTIHFCLIIDILHTALAL